MYLMLQQEQWDDSVIATGESYKLAEIYAPPPSGTPPRREFITRFRLVGLDWREYVGQ
jgi:hypothetical protein